MKQIPREKQEAIKKLRKKGYGYHTISKKFSLSTATVYKYAKGIIDRATISFEHKLTLQDSKKGGETTKRRVAEGKLKVKGNPENFSKIIEKECANCHKIESMSARYKYCKDCRSLMNKKHYTRNMTPEFRKLREEVLERDNYTCQVCGRRGGQLEVDHIIPYRVDPSLHLKRSNLRTLCHDCNMEKYWKSIIPLKEEGSTPSGFVPAQMKST